MGVALVFLSTTVGTSHQPETSEFTVSTARWLALPPSLSSPKVRKIWATPKLLEYCHQDPPPLPRMWVTSSRLLECVIVIHDEASWNLFDHNIRHNEEPTCSVCRGNDFWNMDRHTDHGSNVHEEWRSVATMLVYLSPCRDP